MATHTSFTNETFTGSTSNDDKSSYENSYGFDKKNQNSNSSQSASYSIANSSSNLITRIQLGLSAAIAILLFWIAIVLTLTASRLASEEFVKNAISEGITAGISDSGLNVSETYMHDAIAGGIHDGIHSLNVSDIIAAGVKSVFPSESLGFYVNEVLSNEMLQATYIAGSVMQFDFGAVGDDVDTILNGDVVNTAISKIKSECEGPDCFKAIDSVATFVNVIGSVAQTVKKIKSPPTSGATSGDQGQGNQEVVSQNTNTGAAQTPGSDGLSGSLGIVDAVISFVKSEINATKWKALAAPCKNLYSRLIAVAPSNLTGSYESTCVNGNYFYYNGNSYYNRCDCPIGKIKRGTFCFERGLSCTCEWNDDNFVGGKVLKYMDSVCSVLEAIQQV